MDRETSSFFFFFFFFYFLFPMDFMVPTDESYASSFFYAIIFSGFSPLIEYEHKMLHFVSIKTICRHLSFMFVLIVLYTQHEKVV